jgi:hypothetical protein
VRQIESWIVTDCEIVTGFELASETVTGWECDWVWQTVCDCGLV